MQRNPHTSRLPAVAALLGLLWLCLPAAHLAAAEPTTRIVGGTVVPDNRYPFMATVYFETDTPGRFTPGCGGSLLNNSWVLTAAHCVVNRSTEQQIATSRVAILTGTRDLTSDEGVFTAASNIIVHPDYVPANFRTDIALIELAQPLSGASVISLPAPTSGIPVVAESVVVAGWGTTSEGGSQSADLREVTLSVVSHEECLMQYPTSLNAQANVCAGSGADGGRDSCQGDSGGPLFVERDGFIVQAGIVSFGTGCARPGVPGVYTRLTSYTDWVLGFVPDAIVAGSTNPPNPPEPPTGDVPVLDAGSPSASGNVVDGDALVFEVTGATRVELTTLRGDADLYILDDPTFSLTGAVCESTRAGTALDVCDLPNNGQRLYAGVYGFQASDFSIRAVANQSPSDDDPSGDDDDLLPIGPGGGGSLGWLALVALAGLGGMRHLRRS